MLPAVSDEELETALGAVVAWGWHLPEHPSNEDLIEPLLHLASRQPHELYPVAARRLLNLLDQAIQQNLAEGPTGEDPLLTEDQALGLRIFFGLHPDYYNRSADDRRLNGYELLFSPRRRILPNSVQRTWQPLVERLALRCLRVSYGQEQPPSNARQQVSVRRSAWSIVGLDRRIEYVESTHISRSLVDGLRDVRMRLHNPASEDLDYESVSGVGPPKIDHYAPGHVSVVFPLIEPVGLGEEFTWQIRRRYHYSADSPEPSRNRVSVAGNTVGFAAWVAVTFRKGVPPRIWRYAVHSLNVPVPVEAGTPALVDETGTVFFPETTETRPEFVYGIAWQWD